MKIDVSSILSKISSGVGTITSKLTKSMNEGVTNKSMKIIYFYASLLIFITTLFFVGWMYDLLIKGNSNINAVIQFFSMIVSPATVAAFGFASLYLVDRNNDNIPDMEQLKMDQENEKTKMYGKTPMGSSINIHQGNTITGAGGITIRDNSKAIGAGGKNITSSDNDSNPADEIEINTLEKK